MGILENSAREQSKLRFAALVYHVVMLAALIVGVYGLISLFSLASAEIQHSVHQISG